MHDSHGGWMGRAGSWVVRHRVALGTLVVAGLVCVLLTVKFLADARRVTTESYATEPGEREVITLTDGSAIYLNTASRLSVTVSGRARSVHLLAGEALFEIRHASLPFRVFVDDVVIEDKGTEFSVLRQDSDIQIAVSEGLVLLRCDCNDSTLRVGRGEQLEISRRDAAVQITRSVLTPDLLKDMAVRRDGRFDFSGEPLAEVAREFNRYNRRQLVLAEPKMGRLRMGGTFPIHGVDDLIAALHDLGIAAESSSGLEPDQEVIRLVPGKR